MGHSDRSVSFPAPWSDLSLMSAAAKGFKCPLLPVTDELPLQSSFFMQQHTDLWRVFWARLRIWCTALELFIPPSSSVMRHALLGASLSLFSVILSHSPSMLHFLSLNLPFCLLPYHFLLCYAYSCVLCKDADISLSGHCCPSLGCEVSSSILMPHLTGVNVRWGWLVIPPFIMPWAGDHTSYGDLGLVVHGSLEKVGIVNTEYVEWCEKVNVRHWYCHIIWWDVTKAIVRARYVGNQTVGKCIL